MEVEYSLEEIRWERCRRDPSYFLDNYGWLKDDTAAGEDGTETDAGWRPFKLWDAQRMALETLSRDSLVIVLKARQLGLTWLVLGLALWLLLFKPGSTVLLFSAREDEAKKLLERLRGMFNRLPEWLRPPSPAGKRMHKGRDNTTEWKLPNGSQALCFPANAGRSYTATLVVVDEADWLKPPANLGELLNAVKPTIDAGGKLFLVSSPQKSEPESRFKKIFRAAREGKNTYSAIFLPWSARPERTAEWYAIQSRDSLANTGSLDDLHQEYPATEAEALAPRSLDKRIPPAWLLQCLVECAPEEIHSLHPQPPSVPGLVVYKWPRPGRHFVCGADPAEGNPTSDDSAAVWLDRDSGEEVASLAGKFEPSTFADYVDQVCTYLGGCPVLYERNNHGHAVILASASRKLCGQDGKPGWLTTAKSKAQMWSTSADAFRDQETILHTMTTFHQLASIDGSTLKAPEGQHDDRAIAYGLALVALTLIYRMVGFKPYTHG